MAELRLFGPARQQAGTGTAVVPGDSVGDVLDAAVARFGPGLAGIIFTARIWVNGEMAVREDLVADDDEVAILPPVSGG
jgi:molybdopterin converting factor small subunit